MKKHLLSVTLLLLLLQLSADAKKRDVLFLGNSYTNFNNLPKLVEDMAKSFGDTLVQSSNTPGGYRMQQHASDPTSLNAIKQKNWDIVVIQGQSQEVAFAPGQFATDVVPYAKSLSDSVKKNNSCSEVMFYMTWGRKNGDASNCPFYPPFCTYLGMQNELRKNYLQLAQNNNGMVSPVGAAWKMVRDSVPTIELYTADESHPSLAGSYLAACVFYASIFHTNPHGSTFIPGGLSASNAERLQYFAGKVVMDSLNNWQQHSNYVASNFTYNVNSSNVTFQNSSLKATSYNWTFGDGNNSMQTNPSHTYAAQGKYEVTLNASNNCFSETKKDSVTIGTVGISSIAQENLPIITQTSSGRVTFDLSKNKAKSLTIFNTNGQVVRSMATKDKEKVVIDIAPGVYIYRLLSKEPISNKIFVY